MPRRGNLRGIPLDAVYGRTIVHANRFNGRYTPAKEKCHVRDSHVALLLAITCIF